MDRFFLKHSETIFVLIDIQEKLAAAMKMKDAVVENCLHLIELSK
ncbi:hydrolase, partial [bacterium]|nr:hydrolase [bacterium]